MRVPLGLVDFSQVAEADWIQIPKLLPFGIDFDIKYVFPFLAGYLVTVIETVGVMETLGQVTGTEMTDEDYVAGVRADAVGSMLSPFIGSGPVQSFSQNVGLIPLTRCASKHVGIVTGALLVLMSLCPKFSTIISIMPSSVLGGASMFGTITVSGIKTLLQVELTNRNVLIISSALGIGLGVTFKPELAEQLPGILSSLFSSGISAGTIVALVLNIVLKEGSEEAVSLLD